jgi:hypothetical protein
MPLSPRNDSPARSTIRCAGRWADRACQACGPRLGAGDVELAPRAHEVDPRGGTLVVGNSLPLGSI